MTDCFSFNIRDLSDIMLGTVHMKWLEKGEGAVLNFWISLNLTFIGTRLALMWLLFAIMTALGPHMFPSKAFLYSRGRCQKRIRIANNLTGPFAVPLQQMFAQLFALPRTGRKGQMTACCREDTYACPSSATGHFKSDQIRSLWRHAAMPLQSFACAGSSSAN